MRLTIQQTAALQPFLDALEAVEQLRKQRAHELALAGRLLLTGAGLDPDDWTGEIALDDDGETLILTMKEAQDG